MESSTTNGTAPSRPGRSRRGRALAVAVLAAGTAAATLAPVTAAAGASERSAPSAAISWTGCGTQLECARVSVPLDWAQHGGRTITLSVIRHLASHPGQRIGSLFVNPGGPGDSGVAAVAERGGALDAITGGRFDIVGWDPRGSLANAKLAERRLGHAVLLVHDGYGHMSQSDPSTCVMQALGRYFTVLSTPARGTICPSDRGPFDPAFGQPAASR